ncbi:MAG: amidophosphoribosyltransferase [Candidatus Saccharimonas sp.]
MKTEEDRLHEKCAVVGVSTKAGGNESARIAYQALFALQHRGVEGSGIVSTDGRALQVHRAPGMVRDVFDEDDLQRLEGRIAIGHNRYSTNGGREAHLQPVISPSIGFALAHNGNIPDTTLLEEYLTKRRYITEQYNDSELLARAIGSKLHGGRSFLEALQEVGELTNGAFACVATHEGNLVGFRDPHGVRPLEIGTFQGGMILASETCALDTIGAKHVRSVRPGELVTICNGKLISEVQYAEPTEHFDAFELVYFARLDSIMRGQRVESVRRRFGEELATMHAPDWLSAKTTVVTAVPDTSVPAAEAYAEALGLPCKTAIVKNRYIGRTFMQPTQAGRKNSLRLKHTMVPELIKGKDLVIIDDSIVRGNTLPRLVELAKSLGARRVAVLIASPPIRFPDFYGVDTPEQRDLVAAHMTPEQIRKEIGADYLGFLSVSALVRAIGVPRETLNLAAFTGEYPVDLGRYAMSIVAPVSLEYVD